MEVIKRGVKSGAKHRKKKPNNIDTLKRIAQWSKDNNIKAPADLSSRIDDYLYGDHE